MDTAVIEPLAAKRSLWQSLMAYAASPDPLAATASRFALLLASNQPFYPLYVWYFVGEGWAWTWLTMLSTPFFLAVPAMARKSPLAGRILLALAAAGNTFFCMAIFGEASLVALFLLPCALLTALMFRADEIKWTAALLALGLALFLATRGRFGTAMHPFTSAQYAAFADLHIYSIAGLTFMIAWLFAGRIQDRPNTP